MKKVLNALKFVWKNNKVWLLVSSIVMIIIFTATMIATQNIFLKNTINTVMGGERRVLVSGNPETYEYYKADKSDFKYYQTDSDFKNKKEALKEANNFNELIAEEGFILLENNDNALPLKNKSKVSVFGKNSVNLVYGGSGSGGGNASKAVSLYDSLKSAGFDYNPTLKKFYDKNSQSGKGRGSNPNMGDIPMGLAIGETPIVNYTSSVKDSYSKYNDAALVVISRIGGEGFDLPRTMQGASGANATDHYLELDNNEKALLTHVCASFDKVIVIINCSTSMELGFLSDGTYDIDAALWIGSPGGTGINALGRILNGSVNPSGRTVDTYARDFTQDPSYKNFSNNNVSDGNRYTLGGGGANAYFVEYEEGIYVGYRYYETRAFMEEDIYDDTEWYYNNVVYPFGYGLSYTNFEWEVVNRVPENGAVLTKNGTISITVKVKNTGTVSGKDVVQLYYTAPYYDGIEKAHVVLGDYAKTKEIAPGESQEVTLTLKVSDMASYDYNDSNGNDFKGYELEDGSYAIRIGKNSHDSWENNDNVTFYSVTQNEDNSGNVYGFMYSTDSATGNTVENRFDDVSNHITKYLSRKDFQGTMPTTPTVEEREVEQSFIDSLTYVANDESSPYYTNVMPKTGWSASGDEVAYKLYDLMQVEYNTDGTVKSVTVDYDDPKWENVLDQLTIDQMAYLIGTGNYNTSYINSIAKPKTTDPDGPAGFTNFMGDPTVYDTCFYASECVIGATWNKDIAHDMGVMIGIEGIFGNVKGDGIPYSGWYAPAVNIHRSPFSGRNWEYYSEDSYLSGMMGAEVVKGAKKKGVYAYVKHFALNDQETNRDSNGLITWANEQSMREIYFKPFELTVKEGGTTAMMSSFNRIGTVWAGGSYELMTEVLRDEWGFRGMVITDYNLYDHMPADQMIRAGGDLNLTQNKQPSKNSSSATQVSLIRQATKNILYTVVSSNAMNGMGDGVEYRYAMATWMILLIVGNIVLLVAFGVWGFFAIRYKLKLAKHPEILKAKQEKKLNKKNQKQQNKKAKKKE